MVLPLRGVASCRRITGDNDKVASTDRLTREESSMRRIEFLIASEIPTRTLGWQTLSDAIRSQWSMMDRKPFLGSIAIGFTWKSAKFRPFSRYGRVWYLLARAVKFIGGQPHMGASRFTLCGEGEEPQLRLVIEEGV